MKRSASERRRVPRLRFAALVAVGASLTCNAIGLSEDGGIGAYFGRQVHKTRPAVKADAKPAQDTPNASRSQRTSGLAGFIRTSGKVLKAEPRKALPTTARPQATSTPQLPPKKTPYTTKQSTRSQLAGSQSSVSQSTKEQSTANRAGASRPINKLERHDSLLSRPLLPRFPQSRYSPNQFLKSTTRQTALGRPKPLKDTGQAQPLIAPKKNAFAATPNLLSPGATAQEPQRLLKSPAKPLKSSRYRPATAGAAAPHRAEGKLTPPNAVTRAPARVIDVEATTSSQFKPSQAQGASESANRSVSDGAPRVARTIVAKPIRKSPLNPLGEGARPSLERPVYQGTRNQLTAKPASKPTLLLPVPLPAATTRQTSELRPNPPTPAPPIPALAAQTELPHDDSTRTKTAPGNSAPRAVMQANQEPAAPKERVAAPPQVATPLLETPPVASFATTNRMKPTHRKQAPRQAVPRQAVSRQAVSRQAVSRQAVSNSQSAVPETAVAGRRPSSSSPLRTGVKAVSRNHSLPAQAIAPSRATPHKFIVPMAPKATQDRGSLDRYLQRRLVLAQRQASEDLRIAQAPPRDERPAVARRDLPANAPFEIIDEAGRLTVETGRSRLLKCKAGVFRTAIVDPTVVDIVQFTPREVSIIGKRIGATQVTFWFENDESDPQTYLIEVQPSSKDHDGIQRKYQYLEDLIADFFPNSKVRLTLVADKLVVRGQAKGAAEAAQIMAIIRAQSGGLANSKGGLGAGAVARVLGPGVDGGQTDGQVQIINLLQIPGVQQVALRVKIAELSRSAARGAGIDLETDISINGNEGALLLNSLLNTGAGSSPALLGQINREEVEIGFRWLQQHGIVRVVSEPTLVTLSGHSATFVAGGEFAVPTVVGTGGLSAVTTDFRAFGAIVSFLPTVIDKDRIRLQVSPEFSKIDSDLEVGGTPGLQVRSVSTTVEMREGQTLAVAGLLDESLTAKRTGNLPWLEKIIGTRDTARNETELIILVTPELVHPMDPEEVPPLPGFDVTEATNKEFYWHGRIEGNPTREYRSTIWPRLKRRYGAGGSSMISGPFGHGQ